MVCGFERLDNRDGLLGTASFTAMREMARRVDLGDEIEGG